MDLIYDYAAVFDKVRPGGQGHSQGGDLERYFYQYFPDPDTYYNPKHFDDRSIIIYIIETMSKKFITFK